MGTPGQRGSPPRVRSRRGPDADNPGRNRITSACAEQTHWLPKQRIFTRDHLRVCGADLLKKLARTVAQGSPPRVRSRLIGPLRCSPATGITSACAEQTALSASSSSATWDHLRVCGADEPFGGGWFIVWGSPPRVRSRLSRHPRNNVPPGITSACAEQTSTRRHCVWWMRDHLRVCGADTERGGPSCLDGGSPPRVRSRLIRLLSTFALNWDHLRVCGADSVCLDCIKRFGGSPPRVRSRHAACDARPAVGGITSACAEQTPAASG